MPTEDAILLEKLLRSTDEGRINWQKTATQGEYAAAFGGKWTVTVVKLEDNMTDYYWLTLANLQGEEMLRIYGQEDDRVKQLFEKARRHALKVDEALKDIFDELDTPPF